uniref:DEP domain-containing protein n=1 Tax=Panagrellus redivivus TaxID=6233 RepID=A0A7E4VAT0_PANRE
MPSFKRSGSLPRRTSKSDETISEQDSSLMDSLDISGAGPFEATRRYHKILSQFYKKMPRDQNRRGLRWFSESFTGKDAAELLVNIFARVVPDKDHTIQNAQMFLTRLLSDQLIQNARDPANRDPVVANATLYRFNNDKIEEKIADTAPKRRSNSANSLVRQPTASSRRMSSSMQNLSTMISEFNLASAQTHWQEMAVAQKADGSHSADLSASSYKHSSPCSTSGVEAVDFCTAWKKSLLSRVGLPSVTESLTEGVIDIDVAWNCTRVGVKGIVEVQESYLDLPNDVKKPLNTLMNWAPSSEDSIQPNVLFADVYTKLCCLSPLLPNADAKNVGLLWRHCHCTAIIDRRSIMRSKTNRFLASTASSTQSTASPGSFLSSGSPKFKYIDDQSTPTAMRHQRHSMLAINANPFASSANSVGGEGVPNDLFLDTAQLYLLALTPAVRRKLHVVCRYIRRISSNTNLTFHESKSNIDFMVERLGPCIIDYAAIGNMKDAPILVRTLIECQTRLFTPPKALYMSARNHAAARSRKSATPEPPVFCERIASDAYGLHDHHDVELLKLLDVFISDENMSPEDRSKKLNSFEKTYPKIWAIRFPNGNEEPPKVKKRATTPQARFVNRIRSLTRRDSSNRKVAQ